MNGEGPGHQGGKPQDLNYIKEFLKNHHTSESPIIVYRSGGEWRSTVISLITTILESGDGCVYVVNSGSDEDVSDYLKAEGVDVECVCSSGKLVILDQVDDRFEQGSSEPDGVVSLAANDGAGPKGGSMINLGVESVLSSSRSDEVYKTFVQNFQGIAYQCPCKSFRPNFMDGQVEKITGYSPDDFLKGRVTWIEIIEPEDLPRVLEEGDKMVTVPGYLADNEYRIRRKDGEVRWITDVGQCVSTSPGKDLIILGWVHDITDRKKAEEKLRFSEVNLNEAQRLAHLGSYEYDVVHDRLKWSEEVFRIFGLSRQGCRGRGEDFYDHIHPDDLEGVKLEVARIQGGSGKGEFEHRIVRPDGAVRILHQRFETSFDVMGNPIRNLGTVQDVTEQRLAENALQKELEQRRELEAIINRSPTVVFLWKAEEGWPVELVTENIRQFGYDPEDLLSGNRPFEEMVHPEDLERVALEVDTYTRGGAKEFAQEYRILTKDGDVRWVDDRTTVRRDASGRVTHYQGIVLDITERKKAEEALLEREERLRVIFEAAKNVSFIITDATVTEPRIMELSPGAEKTFGYTREEVFGRPVSLLHLLDDVGHFSQIRRAMEDGGGGFSGLITMVRKSLETFPALLTIYPLLDQVGEVYAFLGVCIDVTEMKRLEEELRRSRDLLEERVKERTAELEAKTAEMERFIYTVSHDLRSPLVTVAGFVGFMGNDLMAGNVERVHTNLKMIGEAVSKMERLLNDTLELSRIGRVVNLPENVPFCDIAQEALAQTAQKAASLGVDLTITSRDTVVHGDRMRIVEVLVNLIENSLKYMGSQEAPAIEIGGRKDADETVFYVRDNGMGIDPSQHEKVFELFYKVDKNTEGTGAGLAIVKQIVEVHGGRTWIESELEKGCTFCFTLPTVRGI